MGTLQKLSDYDKSVPHIGWNYAAMITLNPYGGYGEKASITMCTVMLYRANLTSLCVTSRNEAGNTGNLGYALWLAWICCLEKVAVWARAMDYIVHGRSCHR